MDIFYKALNAFFHVAVHIFLPIQQVEIAKHALIRVSLAVFKTQKLDVFPVQLDTYTTEVAVYLCVLGDNMASS